MIPVGTLCIVVGVTRGRDADGRKFAPGDWNGRTCTIIGHTAEHGIRTHDCQFPNGQCAWIVESRLRPIAPPGNPDEVVTREPELVGGIR